MPTTSWKHINSLLHKAKDKMCMASSIEIQAKRLRMEMVGIIQEIEEIILEQKDVKDNG